ncbi:endonuclease/exonuclease/phosphatase family protein [Streptomyces hydrogenans]|uniref:endonuclease/exonuclease/phosphatase family protein n=1 Tax=Streptomyces hydrogenans TaxID=1873719 RepID=UPI00278C5AB2|nr:endonuclease/exonuclease/phosphatase family protein [Streptomyces hydrogenans]
MRKALTAGALALAALLTNVVGATAASAEPTAVTYTAWTWNVSGHKMNRGATDNGLVEQAAGSIKRPENDVDFVSFNEICYSQYRSIRTALASWNPDNVSYARFQEAIPAGSTDTSEKRNPICGGEAFGKAVFSRHQLGKAEYHTFAQESGLFYRSADGVEHPVRNGMLCAPLVDREAMKFCSVHIGPISTTEKPYGYRQLVELDTLLDGFAAAGQTYMVAGDFNAQPHYERLNRFYDEEVPGFPTDEKPNYGDHRELDDTDPSCPGHGEETSINPAADVPCGKKQPKIDMIFVRTDRLASRDYTADAKAVPDCLKLDADGKAEPGTATPCSDHRVVIGRATLLVDQAT